MKLADFRIGQDFYCGGKRWRCTDVGSRVVVAICLEPHEVVSITDADVDPRAGRGYRHVTDDPSWFDGPPFAVVEQVFDEHSIQACSLVPSDEGDAPSVRQRQESNLKSPSSPHDRSLQTPSGVVRPEPFASRLHFIPRSIRPLQGAIVRLFRKYFERAPGWVLLTTTGRKTGLPREVLLPCERSVEALIVISTYGWQSDWIRNIRRDPRVRVTCAGWVLEARAEVLEDLEAKRSIVSAHPFVPAAPFALVNFLHRTLLRPAWLPFLRWWVTSRPVVVIRPEPGGRASRGKPATA